MKQDTFVAVVKGKDPRQCVAKCLQLLEKKGFNLTNPGKVLLKPNIAVPEPHEYLPGVTDPRVIGALVEEFRMRGASQVLVGEDPVWGLDAKEAFQVTGIADIVKKNGGEVTYFDQEERVELTVKDPHVFRTISVPRSVVECDLLVNVPKMKTSFMTEVTLGIKNLYGCITYEQRKRFHREIDLSYVLADIANTLTPGLTIIDGIVAMDGWGPHAGNTVDMGVIIGGSDIVAVDAVGSSIMGLDPRAAPTTQVAERDGLGTASLSDITILGEKIEDVRKVLARPVFKFVTKAPNVRLFPGGPCPGCRGRIPLVPLEVDPNKKYGIIVGREPVALPEVMDVDEIWLLGNCGLRAGMAYVLRDMVRAAGKGSSWKPSVKVVPGCPPLDYYSEQTCFTGLRQKGWMKRDPIVEDGRYR
jgi:uncharacterized protein (DUF362 family)